MRCFGETGIPATRAAPGAEQKTAPAAALLEAHGGLLPPLDSRGLQINQTTQTSEYSSLSHSTTSLSKQVVFKSQPSRSKLPTISVKVSMPFMASVHCGGPCEPQMHMRRHSEVLGIVIVIVITSNYRPKAC